MATPMKDRRRFSYLFSIFVFAIFFISILASSAFCTPPVIGYSTKQMAVSGNQNMTASGDVEDRIPGRLQGVVVPFPVPREAQQPTMPLRLIRIVQAIQLSR